ncbi:cytochrome b/b6 domain-containing protein [Chryseobacterium sp.]|uniref:cytochrome b/b6 domain-containing protein n=1 Tax=Chryseobacterium sp. TaxID=1871047 RepID=UPI0025BAF0F7|nr:cytochrome b/b6 domain-containing protein [Chryseobacterium sp.]
MKKEISTRFPGVHRLLHWLIAISMTLLFITGFLRMKWMGKKTILNAIEQNVPNLISQEQKISIAKTILSPMWHWHEWAAYAMLFLFGLRIIYMILGGIRFPNPFKRSVPAKERLQGLIYIIFYIFIAVFIITGFYLKWGDGSLKKPMEAVHKWALYVFPIFIVIHLIGIVISELSSKKGITSRMLGG